MHEHITIRGIHILPSLYHSLDHTHTHARTNTAVSKIVVYSVASFHSTPKHPRPQAPRATSPRTQWHAAPVVQTQWVAQEAVLSGSAYRLVQQCGQDFQEEATSSKSHQMWEKTSQGCSSTHALSLPPVSSRGLFEEFHNTLKLFQRVLNILQGKLQLQAPFLLVSNDLGQLLFLCF